MSWQSKMSYVKSKCITSRNDKGWWKSIQNIKHSLLFYEAIITTQVKMAKRVHELMW